MTFSIPAKLKKEMGEFSDVNWSKTTAELLEDKIKRLKILRKLEKLLQGSKIDETDVERIAEQVKIGIAKRHKI